MLSRWSLGSLGLLHHTPLDGLLNLLSRCNLELLRLLHHGLHAHVMRGGKTTLHLLNGLQDLLGCWSLESLGLLHHKLLDGLLNMLSR